MVGRPPIETWNRSELEDKYLKLYSSELELKKKNKNLENELKRYNTKLRKKIAGESSGSPNEYQTTINSLKHEKEILIQKISALKQQLLAYTTPQMRQVGINLLTSRPTNMTTLRAIMTSGERPSAKMVIGTGKWSNKNGEIINQQNDVISKGAQINNKQKLYPNNDETQKNNKITNSNSRGDRNVTTPTIDSQNLKNTDMELYNQLKVNYIKINRELRERNDETRFLQKQLEDKITLINNLQQELNLLTDENVVLKKEKKQSAKTLKELEKKIQLNLEDFDGNVESTPKLINNFETERNKIEKPLLEAEIRQLKDEIYSLKEINEKLIQNSFEQDNCGKVKIDQLNSLKGTIETLNEKVEELKNNNDELERKIQYLNIEKKAIERHLSNKEKNQDTKSSNLELKTILDELSQIKNINENTIQVDKNVNDLFVNINNMIDKYSTDIDISDDKEFEYKKMYEEVHEEMEKLRNLLVLQHNINEKQINEIELLKMNNNLLSEELTKRKMIIEENKTKYNLEINKLKRQINKKYSLPYNIDVSPGPLPLKGNEDISTINEMSVVLKGIQFNEKFKTNSQCVYFISLEFFNFEILTTPSFTGVSCSFEYTAIYDLMVSELLVYYMENEGIYIELYKIVGSECTKLGSNIIPLKSLFTSSKILDNEVIIYDIKDNIEIGTIKYNITLTDIIFECIKEGYKNLYFKNNITTIKNIELLERESIPNIIKNDDKINDELEKEAFLNDNIENNKNNIKIENDVVNLNHNKEIFEEENILPEYNKNSNKEPFKSNNLEENELFKKRLQNISDNDENRINKLPKTLHKTVLSNIEEETISQSSEKSDKDKEIPKIAINVDIYTLLSLSNITKNANITTFIAYQIPGHPAFLSEPIKGLNPIYNSHKEWNISLESNNISNLAKESIFIYIVDNDKYSKNVPDNNVFDEAVLCYTIIDTKNIDLNKPLYGDYDVYLGNGKKSDTKIRLAIYTGAKKDEKDFFDKPLTRSTIDNDNQKEKEENIKDNTLINDTISNDTNKKENYVNSEQSSTTSSETKTYVKSDTSNKSEINGNKIVENDNLSNEVEKLSLPEEVPPIPPPRKISQKAEGDSISSNSSVITVTEMNVNKTKNNIFLPPIRSSISSEISKNEIISNSEDEKLKEIKSSIVSFEDKSNSETTSIKSNKTNTSKSFSEKETKEHLKGVGFMSPLHYSISPSNSYASYASSNNGEKNGKLHNKKEPPLYNEEKMKSIKPITHSTTSNNNITNDNSKGGILNINILSFFTTENFYYIYGRNINFTIFFEWLIIDIDQDMCESKESFPISKYPNIPIIVNSKNEYILTKRQIELLEQWQELGSKLTFNMVSDPGNEGECDDIGTASFDLQYINIGHSIDIKVYTNDGDWIASINVEVNLQYT
uniref:C2-C2_1 domain-containing protein n=1 Tax=Strongyloides stercoralis TaxID=6248 RepID=A0A0K0EM29_STRER